MEDFSLPVALTTPGLRSVTAGLYGGPMRGARRRQRHDGASRTGQTSRTAAVPAEPDEPTSPQPGWGPGRHRPNRRKGRWAAVVVVALLAVAIPGGALYGLRWVHDHPDTMITFGDEHTVPARSSRDHTRTVGPSPTASPTPSPSASRSASAGPAESTTAYEREVVREINAARARAGCPALRNDSRLAAAARAHSDDMAARNYFDHNSPDGVTPWDRAKAAGYAQPSAENIAAGQATPAAAVKAWLNSPGHRANILNCSSRATGVGFAEGGKLHYYWTQLFGYQ